MNTDVYERVYWDASAYLGQDLYIKVVDNHTGGWGYVGMDDFNLYFENNHNYIIKPDFEHGNLHGWTVSNNGYFARSRGFSPF